MSLGIKLTPCVGEGDKFFTCQRLLWLCSWCYVWYCGRDRKEGDVDHTCKLRPCVPLYTIIANESKTFDMRPLNPYVRVTLLAGEMILSRLRYLLYEHSFPKISPGTITDADEDNFLPLLSTCPHAVAGKHKSELVLEAELEATYATTSDSFEWLRPSTRQSIRLPQWIKAAIPEVLFENHSQYADRSTGSISVTISSSFECLPLDLRKLAGSLIIAGEFCHIPGLQRRLQHETGRRILRNEFGPDLAWVGGSLAESLKVGGTKVTLSQFNSLRRVPDWSGT